MPVPDILLPETLIAGVTPGHIAHSEELLRVHNLGADAIIIPAIVGGGSAAANTAMIDDIIAGAPEQSTLRFRDPGPVAITGGAAVIDKAIRLIGASGRFGTRLVPTGDTSDPILDFDTPAPGSIWDVYGPSVERLAIDLTAAPSATGIRTGVDTGWFEAVRLFIDGGTRSLDHNGPNAYFDRCLFADASDCMVYVTDGGLEVSFNRMNLARNIVGTTDAFMKVILATDGQKGDLRLNQIQGGSGQSGAITNSGIVITAPSLTNLPVFASRVTIDNVIGGGPGLTLENIESVDWAGGWINTAGAAAGPPVRIYGGGDITFRGVKYRGSFLNPRTYDFTGGSTRGFRSRDCYCPTGPVYWLPASGKPTDMVLDDDLVGVTDLTQVTNDVEGLRAATARRWGPMNLQDRLSITSVPWIGTPAMSIGTLGDGGVPGQTIIDAPAVDGFYSQFILFVFSPAGTSGLDLKVISKDEIGETVTIQSRKGDGSTETADTSIVGYLRFDLPH